MKEEQAAQTNAGQKLTVAASNLPISNRINLRIFILKMPPL